MEKMIRYYLIVCLLACADHAAPDANVEAPIVVETLTGPSTWWYAMVDWAQDYCAHMRKCDYDDYYLNFDDDADDCIAYFLEQFCYGFTWNCNASYPASLYALDIKCRSDMESLDCTITDTPPSCSAAFAPNGTP